MKASLDSEGFGHVNVGSGDVSDHAGGDFAADGASPELATP